VTIKIYDGSSTLVRTLVNGVNKSSGANSSLWDLKDNSSTAVADGTYTYKIDAADAAGNNATQQTGTVTYDTTKPDVTVDQAGAQVDPTNGLPITFTAVFSEHINGFTGTDVTLGGTADHSTATTTVTNISGNSYEISVD